MGSEGPRAHLRLQQMPREQTVTGNGGPGWGAKFACPWGCHRRHPPTPLALREAWPAEAPARVCQDPLAHMNKVRVWRLGSTTHQWSVGRRSREQKRTEGYRKGWGITLSLSGGPGSQVLWKGAGRVSAVLRPRSSPRATRSPGASPQRFQRDSSFQPSPPQPPCP